MGCWRLDCSGSGEGQVVSSCECGNDSSGCMYCRETTVWLQKLMASRVVPICLELV
jgi:hypothetical protein